MISAAAIRASGCGCGRSCGPSGVPPGCGRARNAERPGPARRRSGRRIRPRAPANCLNSFASPGSPSCEVIPSHEAGLGLYQAFPPGLTCRFLPRKFVHLNDTGRVDPGAVAGHRPERNYSATSGPCTAIAAEADPPVTALSRARHARTRARHPEALGARLRPGVTPSAAAGSPQAGHEPPSRGSGGGRQAS